MIAALGTAAVWTAIERRDLGTISIQTPRATIVVEVADTAEARSSGLANRETLSGVDGLLLKWEAPGRHPIWMRGMRFSLDLLWIDAEGRVLAALTDVPPCPADPCPLYEPPGSDRSVAVLELPGNASARHGLAEGASVSILDLPKPR
jgi:hypothetical protein